MTAAPNALARGGAEVRDLGAEHAELVADKTVQFTLPGPPPQPKPPAWAEWLADLFETIAPAMEWVFWGVLALVVLAILGFIGREVVRSRWGGRQRPVVLTEGDSWRPTAAQARVLLADADALAAEGRFAEAAHLLLRRSVQDIQTARPRLVKPALTSRDISVHPDLSTKARDTFASIARVVERSLFGGQKLGEPDWVGARAAYTDFALPGVLT